MELVTVILPTYNERYNIENAIITIDTIFKKANVTVEILVIDDNSPDYTCEVVKKLQKQELFCELNLLVREVDHGLSKSINDGFKIAKGEYIFVTDADLQHDVDMIPLVLDYFEMYDVLVGSRYCAAGKIEKWSIVRRVISFGATGLGRCLFPELTDPVSGFFGVKRSVIEGIEFDKSRGYKILLDVLEYGKYDNVKEFPYTFKSRSHGESKLGSSTILDFVIQLYELVKYALYNRVNSHIWKTWGKFIKFGIVGASGVIVNYGAYYLLSRLFDSGLVLSSFIAIELSIISNFILNNYWTFKNHSGRGLIYKAASFQGISFIGLVMQIAALYVMVNALGIYDLIAYPVAIVVVFLFNYILNTRVTWKE